MFEIYCLIWHLGRLRVIPRIGFLFGIDKTIFSHSPRYYQNCLHFFARTVFLMVYFGGKKLVEERFLESIFIILFLTFIHYQVRNSKLVRGKAIKREIDQRIKKGLREADYYHDLLQAVGTLSFFAGVFSLPIIEKFPRWSIVLISLNFIFGIISSELLFRREQSTYHGK
ncbi:hypothetical protein KKC45_03410 [Patescibacteria group bacterium]|nr:hypothetical protein [Patescibacteria group bacterium]